MAVVVQTLRHDYSSTNVTTSAYVELDAGIDEQVGGAEIFDSSGQSLIFATGAAGSESDYLHIMPGGNGAIPLVIPKGIRISVKAVSGNATTGELIINFHK